LALVGSALGTNTVREHRFLTLRTQGGLWKADMIMRASHAPAGL